MTTIRLTDEWRIKSDTYCWMLQKRMVRKSGAAIGKEDWESKSYHTSPAAAINKAAEMNLRLSDAQTFTEALAEVERFTTAISSSLSPKYMVTER